MIRRTHQILFLILALSFAGSASAALNFYVTMTANGNPIEGEPTVVSMGGEDVSALIEGYVFDHQVLNSGGRASHGEIRIIKRVDKSTPLLYAAVSGNQSVDAEIWFYAANGDTGLTERIQTWTLSRGAITSIAPYSTSGIAGGNQAAPFLEAITISYSTLTIESNTGSTVYEYP